MGRRTMRIQSSKLINHVSEFNGNYEQFRQATDKYPYKSLFNSKEYDELIEKDNAFTKRSTKSTS